MKLQRNLHVRCLLTGSLLKDMSEAAAKCVFGVLEVCLHAKFGPFEPALYSLVQHCPDEPVLVEASRLFWYFSRSDANKPAMLIAGHLAVVCNAIAAHVHMPRVLFHLVVGLSNVALSTEAADALAALGIFEEVASAAEKNADQLQVQLPTCVLIGHMLRHTRDDDAGRQAEKNSEYNTPRLHAKQCSGASSSTHCTSLQWLLLRHALKVAAIRLSSAWPQL